MAFYSVEYSVSTARGDSYQILFTGGTSFIRSHLTDQFLRNPICEVDGLENFNDSFNYYVKKMNVEQFTFCTNFTFLKGNIGRIPILQCNNQLKKPLAFARITSKIILENAMQGNAEQMLANN